MTVEQSRYGEPQGWEPASFQPETTTVWSFPERGAWATHDGAYRGNWSPQIPRNVMLRYTAPGDLVLDPFIGGGTTAVEATLLGRRIVAGDLNLAAVTRTRTHLERLKRHGPEAGTGTLLYQDARSLAVADGAVQLVLLHPPYADAIRYSRDTAGDLSPIAAGPFLDELRRVAAESQRVLASGGHCALLMGDLLHRGHVVPLGFAAIQAFRQAGLALEELVIKRQHHTSMAARWAPVGAQRGFLLLAHEYLAVFRRAADPPQPAPREHLHAGEQQRSGEQAPPGDAAVPRTTVWTLPAPQLEAALPAVTRRVFGRRASGEDVLFLRAPQLLTRAGVDVPAVLSRWLDQVGRRLTPDGVLAVETQDVRVGDELQPLGLEVCRALRRRRDLWLKEIITVVPAEDGSLPRQGTTPLAITHRYLLVASRAPSAPLPSRRVLTEYAAGADERGYAGR